jgi:hypothetical protein
MPTNKYFELCRTCDGMGELAFDPEFGTEYHHGPIECGECVGFGYFFTEEGEELIRFLRLIGVEMKETKK